MYHQIGARYNVPMPTSEVISHKDEHADLLLDALASSIVLGYCTSESFRNVFRQDYDSDPLEFLMNERTDRRTWPIVNAGHHCAP